MTISLGVLLALGAALVFTVYSFFATIIAGIAFLIVRPAASYNFPPIVWIVTLLSTIGYSIYSSIKFYSNKYIEASRRTLLTQISPIVTLFASALILHEGLTLRRLLAVALIVLGNIIALYKHGGKASARGIEITLLGSAILGITYVADKYASAFFPLSLYMFITYGLPALYLFTFSQAKRKNAIALMKQEVMLRTWRLPLLSALSVFGYFLLLKAYSLVDASVASPTMSSATILTALGGIIILKERTSIGKKLVGAVFVFAGVILLR